MTSMAEHGTGFVRPEQKGQPFLQWAGGKARLIEQIEPFFPTDYGRYFEPFIGGGAFYFHMEPAEAVISATTERSVRAYRTGRGDLPALLGRVDALAKLHSRDRCS